MSASDDIRRSIEESKWTMFLQMTPREIVDLIVEARPDNVPVWLQRGVIEPDDPIDVEVDVASAYEILSRVAEASDAILQFHIDGRVDILNR
jgi:hypothetical protein